MSDIFKQINEVASFISKEDLDKWVVPKLMEHYFYKLNYLAVKTYGANGVCNSVAKKAFLENAKSEINKAVDTFIFKSEHWKTGRDLNTYLLTSLNRLSDRLISDKDSIKKINIPICPGCKFLDRREYMIQDGQFWRCQNCTSDYNRIRNEISLAKENNNFSLIMKLESRSQMFLAFAKHSRKGYRCGDCARFIPESFNGENGISCPYPDCMFFGDISKLELMSHPVGLSNRTDLSLQTKIESDSGEQEIQDLFIASNVNADSHIEIEQAFSIEYKLLNEVIEEQLKAVKRTNHAGTMLQKVLMYEAYNNMVKSFPEDMVSYLVHRKQASDFPIQSKIFQEYVRLVQESLPYSIVKENSVHEVISLLDPKISLFEGISKFDAIVKLDNTIPNNTKETYTGGRKFKEYGPCFIGMIRDIRDKSTGLSLKHKIKEYSFVKIKMTDDVLPGTQVEVTHYRIPSHYEMGSLVYLQRCRKRIVNSIYFKLHKKRRNPRE